MWPQLRELIREQSDFIDRNTYLLDIYAGMLIAEKDWVAAEETIRRLKAAAKDEGRAETRTASIMMQRDGKFAEAAQLLTQVLAVAPNGRDNIRRVRAMAAANSGGAGIATARTDVEYLKTRPNGAESARRIEAVILLVEGDHDAALQHLASIRTPSAQDKLLEGRILEAKSHDIMVPLSEREECKKKSAEIRARYSIVDEFDADI